MKKNITPQKVENTLYLLVWVQGSGKSTYIKKHWLENYVISLDDLRMKYACTNYDVNWEVYMEKCLYLEKIVHKQFQHMLDHRLKSKIPTIIDNANNVQRKTVRKLIKKAKKYNTDVKIHVFEKPIGELLEINKLRWIDVIEDEITLKYYKSYQEFKSEDFLWLEQVANIKEDIEQRELLRYNLTDKYEKLIIVGDIHGSRLMIEELEREYSKTNFYVFLGDYLEKGKHSIYVARKLAKWYQNGNILLVEGNHERRMRDYANGTPWEEMGNSPEAKQMAKECKDKNYSPVEAQRFINLLQSYAIVRFGQYTFYCTHGGISTKKMFENPAYLSSRVCIYGTSAYENIHLVEQKWNSEQKETDIMIHGHRNMGNTKLRPYLNVINLEQGITSEKGNGTWAWIVVDSDGTIHEHLLKKCDASDISTMYRHPYIKEQKLESGLNALNFSRDAFKEWVWDNVTTNARWLFYDPQTKKVKMRGYEKFFNVDEIETIQEIVDWMEYPVYKYKKENGFFWLVGYHNNQVVYASKKTTEWDHAQWVQKYLKPFEKKIEQIVKKNLTLVFELCIPEDVHIKKYQWPHIYLLDVFRNDSIWPQAKYKDTPRLWYEYVQKTAKFIFGWKDGSKFINNERKKNVRNEWGEKEEAYYHHKELLCTIDTPEDLKFDFEESMNDTGLEWYVYEGTNQKMTKLKTKWYTTWKWIRGKLETYNSGKEVRLLNFEHMNQGLDKEEWYVTEEMVNYINGVIKGFILTSKPGEFEHVNDLMNEVASFEILTSDWGQK